jgi:D-glycerate 3-kinase
MTGFPKSKWLAVKKKPNIVIFEGWCVGVTSQKKKDLVIPINKLEKQKDKKKIWRQTVNKELQKIIKKYLSLIDKLIFLKVPSFKYVYKWRLLQEKKLRAKSKGNKIMSDKQVKNFIMYYERLTKNMLKILPKKANTVINIDKNHRLKSIKFN